MEKVNKHNYEAFFLDYLEGSLSVEQEADLLAFLKTHPNLRSELESMMEMSLEDLKLQSVPHVLEGKKELQQVADLDELIIASVEGLLSAEEEMDLQNRVKKENAHQIYNTFRSAKLEADLSQTYSNRDSLKQLTAEAVQFLASLSADEKKQLAVYRKSFLQSDVMVQYPDKEQLKRKDTVVIPLFYRYASAAAAIILLVGLFFFNQNTINQNTLPLAGTDSMEKADPKMSVSQLADKAGKEERLPG